MTKLLMIFLLVSCARGGGGFDMGLDPVSPLMGETLLVLVNEHRKSEGLRPLLLHTELNKIALYHSTNMANGSVDFDHSGMSGRCSDGRRAIGGGNLCGENVAHGQKTAQAVFESWMRSPGHRDNIEEPRHTHMGLGYRLDSDGAPYWTQLLLEKN